MGCCGKSEEDTEACVRAENPAMEELCKKEQAKSKNMPYMWHPTVSNMQQIAYVRRLERQHEALQTSYFNLSSQMARLQFRIRQIIQAAPCDRAKLIDDLERVVFQEVDIAGQRNAQELPSLEQHNLEMGDIKKKQHMLIKNLRQQIGSFQQASDSLATEYQYHDQEKGKERTSSQKSLTKKPSKVISAKPSETKSRKSGGSEYFMNSASGSTETCSSVGRPYVSEVRSTSFKELRDMYQKGCTKSA
ncbi:uncharacterized protein LOC135955858 [Calliphora vicina]|uniref:uncharacterized protein LOC135955858 n=1 Tax=Calliphora vicina TaxID=7373 RepID=UPI00325AF2AF